MNDRITSTATDLDLGLNKAEDRNKEFEIRFKALNEKITFLERTILNRDKEIDILKKDIEQRNAQIGELKNLEYQIIEKDEDINHLKNIIEQMNSQKDIDKKDFTQRLLNKDLEVEKINEILERVKKQLETNENLIHVKDLEIERLENDFEAKTIQLKKTSDEDRLSSKLIKKIDKLMHLKGFVTDKELQELQEKIEKNQAALNF